jgi:hypothetical protein
LSILKELLALQPKRQNEMLSIAINLVILTPTSLRVS